MSSDDPPDPDGGRGLGQPAGIPRVALLGPPSETGEMTWIKFWPLQVRRLKSGILVTYPGMDPAFDETIDARMAGNGYHRVQRFRSYTREVTELTYRKRDDRR